MTSSYKILFEIEILNDYYKDNRCLDFSIVPSAETSLLLKRYQLLYRVVANKLVVLMKTGIGDTPLTFITQDENFVFYLGLNIPAFVNFTNVDLNALTNKRFYFSNLNQNKQGSAFNITKKIAPYDNVAFYKPGDVVDDGTNTVFECIKNTTGHDTTTAFWTPRGPSQFASVADMVLPSSKIFNHVALLAVAEYKIVVFSLNKASGTYTDVVKTETQKFAAATRNIQVELSSLKKGKYRMTINSEELLLYIDDEFLYGGYFGVIEILSHLPNNNEFSFFGKIPIYINTKTYQKNDLVDDGTANIFECLQSTTGNDTTNADFWKFAGRLQGIIKEITYTIHFSNRRAFWKYRTAFQKVDNIKVKGSHDPDILPFAFFSSDPAGQPNRKDFFISNDPLLISEKAEENNFELILTAPHDSINPAAPKADPSAAGMLTQKDDDFFCNIYLNY